MIKKKILLVGNFGVGKTSLIRRFVSNEFSEDYISTIGVRVSKKELEFEGQRVKLLIWDVAGTQGNQKIPKAYFLGASAAMLVFDLSRDETYLNIQDILQTMKDLSGLKEFLVIGNKVDLLDDAELERVRNLVPIKIDFETSAKEGQNVEDAFKVMAFQS